MESCLETIRNLHEERERLIDTIVKEKMAEKLTHKAKVNSEQRVKKFVDVSVFIKKIEKRFSFSRDTMTSPQSLRASTRTRIVQKIWRWILFPDQTSLLSSTPD